MVKLWPLFADLMLIYKKERALVRLINILHTNAAMKILAVANLEMVYTLPALDLRLIVHKPDVQT